MIDIRRNTLERGGREVSLKQRILKVSNLVRSIGNGRFGVSSHTNAGEELTQSNATNAARARMRVNKRKHEVETQKAMLISLSRHDRWKAGGPV